MAMSDMLMMSDPCGKGRLAEKLHWRGLGSDTLAADNLGNTEQWPPANADDVNTTIGGVNYLVCIEQDINTAVYKSHVWHDALLSCSYGAAMPPRPSSPT
jgi:hypothetical protein